MASISIIGQKFGQLTALEFLYKVKDSYYYRTVCDCSNEHITTRSNLKKGISLRCKTCKHNLIGLAKIKNNSSKDRYTYSSYINMKYRCANFEKYSHVTVCEEWSGENGFENFLKDMGSRPPNTTLDRIDNYKGYCKENCRWSTRVVQGHNKRKKTSGCTTKYIGVRKYKDADIYACAIQVLGKSLKFHGFDNIEDAVVLYDNLSEYIYGDRPNKTEYREVIPVLSKTGSIRLDKRTNKYYLYLYNEEGKRVRVGVFDNEQEPLLIKAESDRLRFYRELEKFKKSYDESLV